MSHPIDPIQPRPPSRAADPRRAVHHEGELLGLRYELGVRVSELAPPEGDQRDPGPPGPNLSLPEAT